MCDNIVPMMYIWNNKYALGSKQSQNKDLL